MNVKELKKDLDEFKEYVNSRIQKDRRCNRCNHIVLTSELDEYPFQCLFCDENLYGIETYTGGASCTDREVQILLYELLRRREF